MLRRLLAAAVLLLPAAALADRKPTAEEMAKVEAVLRAQGFTEWKEVEVSQIGTAPVFEIDDARGADSKTYDLKLDAGYTIVERKAD